MQDPELLNQSAAYDMKVVSREIVDRAIEELSDARLSRSARVLAQTVLRVLKRRSDYDDVITDVERLNGEVGQISTILQRCATALLTAEEEAARGSPGSAVWLNMRTRAVARAISLDQPDLGLRLLTTIWVEGLVRNDWATCRRILSTPGFPRETTSAFDQMRRVTEALADETYAAALDPLDDLLDTHRTSADRIGQGTAVRLGVLRTRILSREFSDREMIRQSAREAVARAGDSDWKSLALAGLAETQLAADEVEAARDTVAQAIGAESPHADAFVVSGLLRERDGYWALADHSYDRAVQRDPAVTEAILLRPVPPRLLVRAAISSTVDVRHSVDLLNRALVQGIAGEGDYSERYVYLARAEQLIKLAHDDDERGLATEAQQHRRDAAASLVQAGHGFSLAHLMPQAVELFQRACDLAPDVAEFRWTHAEALRLNAWQVDGTVDLQVLETARDQLQCGLSLRPPNDTEAWVLATHALVAEGLSDRDDDPALLVERALLKDPDYVVGCGLLAGILRRQGFLQEAFEASTNGRDTAVAFDPDLFREHLNLVLDRGKYDEALRLVEYRSLRQPGDAELALDRADVLLRMQRPREALSVLSGQGQTDWVRLLRGYCLFADGDEEGSRAEFWSLWNDTRLGPAGHIAGWAAFRAGLLDEAIALYQDLRVRAPADRSYTRDLGQMLLVRGEVAEGTSLLKKGIAACPYAGDLRQLATDEFDFVRHATADARHGAEVARALEDLGPHISRRCRKLLESRRPAGDVPALLGTARVAMHAGRPLEALAIYEKLVGREDVPEALEAAMRAGWSANEAAVVLFAKNDHDAAQSLWSSTERAIARISLQADPDLLKSLTCRRMIADLSDGLHDQVAARLAAVQGGADLEDAMTDAVRKLSYDAAHLWAVRDGLLALSERADLGEERGRLIVEAANHLPLSRVYYLDAAAADTSGSPFLFGNPLELRCGSAVEELCHSGELKAAISELQERIEAEMGVRIPWVYPVAAPHLANWQVDVRLYARWIGGLTLSGGRETWVPQVMEELEDRVRGYLFRLVGVDDVALWLEGWDVSNRDAPTWEPADPRADRLRLARVLRMLLREQVSVIDRETIVGAVRSRVGVEKEYESATLNTLLEVRRRLGSAALGVGADMVVVTLPSELEERVAAGLPPDRPVWELPRLQAHQLVSDLRAWLHALPLTPAVISVADGRVRPFVWRLLAAERPAVRVLSKGELS